MSRDGNMGSFVLLCTLQTRQYIIKLINPGKIIRQSFRRDNVDLDVKSSFLVLHPIEKIELDANAEKM